MTPLSAPERAFLEAFLGRLPEAVRRSGRSYALSGMVGHLRREGLSGALCGTVRDREPREVVLDPTILEEKGTCSCRIGSGCAHCAGVAVALLTFNAPAGGTTTPSAGAAGATGKTASPPAAAGPIGKAQTPVVATGAASTAAELAELARQGLGRALEPAESATLSEVARLHEASRKQGCVALQDLARFAVSGRQNYLSPFDQVRPWPEWPHSIVDFLHGLAREAARHRLGLPPVLEAVCRSAPPAAGLAALWRREEVDQWRRRLEIARGAVEEARSRPAPAALEFRVVVGGGTAELEQSPAGHGSWTRVRRSDFNALAEASLSGEFTATDDSGALWDLLLRRHHLGAGGTASGEAALLRLLPTLFERADLAGRFVDASGRVLERPAEPLRWRALEPGARDGDYVFELVMPDGAPPGEVQLSVSGRTHWIVAQGRLWQAPPLPDGFDGRRPTRVPAGALETLPGVRLLEGLGVEMPPRLSERVVRVVLRPRIRGWIPKDHPAGDCALFDLVACRPDGTVAERFGPDGWHAVEPPPEPADRVVLVVRDALAAAPEALETLGARRLVLGGEWGVRITRSFPEHFAAWARSRPPELALDLDPALRSLLAPAVKADLQVDLRPADGDWYELSVQVATSSTELSEEELQALMDAKGAHVRLGDRGWRRLESSLPPDTAGQLERLGIHPRRLAAGRQRFHALQLAEVAEGGLLPQDRLEAIRRRAEEIRSRVTPDVPEEIRAELRPYQVEGFHFLAYLAENGFGGVLADDMGLGKTLQALTWFAWLRSRPSSDPGARARFLVVCPKSVAPNWRAEAGRFLPRWRVHVWRPDGPVTLRTATQVADILVLNYAQLRRATEELTEVAWTAVILDEAQAIKNPDSQTARAARELKAVHRLALTGTPIENRLLDLWSLFAFALPGLLGHKAWFQRNYENAEDPQARRRLSARVKPFLLRRTKSQVAKDLPDRIEEDLPCEMEGLQAALYAEEFQKARTLLRGVRTQADLDQFRFHFLTSLLRLRQICCHPALVDPTRRKEGSAKLEALLDLLEPLMEEGQKVLVFSQFVSMLDLLREEISARGWKTFRLAGDTADRSGPVDGFQRHEGGAVFLISIKAGGSGLNLTAASYVVLFDPWWNPAVEAQAIDRSHRIGQRQTVIAYRLLAKDSVEEKIRKLQEQKKAVAEDILGEERFSGSLTVDDFRFLLDEPPAPRDP